MSWTDGKPWVATEKDCQAPWSCGKPGEFFRCAWCGYRFKPGDTVRWVYTNGEKDGRVSGNPFVCAACDGPRPKLLAKLAAMHDLAVGRLWWFSRRPYE